MSYSITATQAKVDARADGTILDETYKLMSAVITAAGAGNYSSTTADATTMTEATPTITITGSQANPTITGTPTIIIAGSTITLGTTGLNLNSVIADINDAGVTGVVASKNSSNNLVITYTTTASSSWTVVVGAGTANTALGLTAATSTATNPASVTYFNVWQGTAVDRAKTDQMNEVIKYFQGLGYQIERQSNVSTTTTFKWVISW